MYVISPISICIITPFLRSTFSYIYYTEVNTFQVFIRFIMSYDQWKLFLPPSPITFPHILYDHYKTKLGQPTMYLHK